MKRPISKTNLILSCTALLTGIIVTTYLLAFSGPSLRSASANAAATCTEMAEDAAAPASLPVSSSIIFEAVTGHLLSTGF
jgi:aconitase A